MMNPELLKSIEDACIKNIKSEGAFDKLRSGCLGEIEKEPQFQQLNTQIEDQVIHFVKSTKNRSTSSQPKSEVRKGVRSHLNSQLNGLLKSQMDSLVDSIIKSQESSLKDIVKEAVDSFTAKDRESSSKLKVKIESKSDENHQVEGMEVVAEEKEHNDHSDKEDTPTTKNTNNVNKDSDVEAGELYISLDSELEAVKEVAIESNSSLS